jgi:hypothetical protein
MRLLRGRTSTNTASAIAMPLPPSQDPELEAREHPNRFTDGTSGGEVSPNI